MLWQLLNRVMSLATYSDLYLMIHVHMLLSFIGFSSLVIHEDDKFEESGPLGSGRLSVVLKNSSIECETAINCVL